MSPSLSTCAWILGASFFLQDKAKQPADIQKLITSVSSADGFRARRAAAEALVAKGKRAVPALLELLAARDAWPEAGGNHVYGIAVPSSALFGQGTSELQRALRAAGTFDRSDAGFGYEYNRARRTRVVTAIHRIYTRTHPRMIAAWLAAQIDPTSPRVIDALVEAISKDSEGVRAQCMADLRKLPQALVLRSMQRTITDANDASGMIRAFILASTARPSDACAQILRSEDRLLRVCALRALDLSSSAASLTKPQQDLVLAQALSDDRDCRSAAYGALAKVKGASIRPRLAAALQDPDSRVRRRAAWALGALTTSSSPVEIALVGAVTDDDARVRQLAIEALARHEPGTLKSLDQLPRAIAAGMKDEAKAVQCIATLACARVYPADAALAPKLLAFLESEDETYRQTALVALSKNPDLAQHMRLKRILAKVQKLESKSAATNRLVRITLESYRAQLFELSSARRWSEDEAINSAIRKLSASDAEQRVSATRVLAKGEAEVRRCLLEVLEDESISPKSKAPRVTRRVRANPSPLGPLEAFDIIHTTKTEAVDALDGVFADPREELYDRGVSAWPARRYWTVRRETHLRRQERSNARSLAAWILERHALSKRDVDRLWKLATRLPDSHLFAQLVQTLSKKLTPEDVLARSGRTSIRGTAQAVLSEIGAAAFPAVLKRALEFDAWPSWRLALELPPSKPERFAPELFAYLRRGGKQRKHACEILRRLGSVALEAAHKELARGERGPAELSALALIQVMSKERTRSRQQVRAILFDTARDVVLRQLAFSFLLESGDAALHHKIAELRASKEEKLRALLAISLPALKIEEGYEIALELARRDSSWLVRFAALRALPTLAEDTKLLQRELASIDDRGDARVNAERKRAILDARQKQNR